MSRAAPSWVGFAARRAAALAIALGAGSLGAAGAAPSVLVTTQPLATHALSETVTAYGSVQADPDAESSVSVSRGGLLERMRVRLGARVASGDALFEFETAPAARLEFQQAQAAVEYARKDLKRLQRLFERQLATRDQVASARKTLGDAQAKLQAQQQLGANQPLEIVRAPFDGIVTRLLHTQGERVQADTVVLILARGSPLIVPLGVEPEAVGDVRAGTPVTLSPVFQSDIRIETHIERVHAMVNPTTRLVDALVKISDADAAHLVLGTRLKGVITLRAKSAFAVPRSAVLRDESGAYLFAVRDSRAHRVEVETGIAEKGLIEVNGKLQAGEPVVISGNYELRDGMQVREAKP